MVEIVRVKNDTEIEGIRLLQKENLKKLISTEEATKEGFVTAEYSFEFLKQMNTASPSVIAKEGDKVVGYAMVAVKSIYGGHPLLDSLFDETDKLSFNNKPLKETNYVLVGQLCVGKNYRGQGIVQKMYGFFKTELQKEFTYCITDVAQDNPRSIKAHLKTGFEVIHTIGYGGASWDIVLWDWNK